MIGGYMTFMGIEAKGKYRGTVIEDVLPVNLLDRDDREEHPEGVNLTIVPDSHPILAGLPEVFPYIMGYNKLKPKPGATVVVEYKGDPIITVGSYGKGRAVAYATDCAPHWASMELCTWEHYPRLWQNIVRWIAG